MNMHIFYEYISTMVNGEFDLLNPLPLWISQ